MLVATREVLLFIFTFVAVIAEQPRIVGRAPQWQSIYRISWPLPQEFQVPDKLQSLAITTHRNSCEF
jgi:hypothetical protein